MTTTGTIVSMYITVKDVGFPVSHISIPFYSANFHVYTNDVYYGDGTIMKAKAVADSVISLEKGDLKNMYFQNETPGNVAYVAVVATVDNMDVQRLKDQGG